jgi:hypothetical protein
MRAFGRRERSNGRALRIHVMLGLLGAMVLPLSVALAARRQLDGCAIIALSYAYRWMHMPIS